MKRMCIGLVASVTLWATPAFATTISFDSDTPGLKANGFVSRDSPLVRFTDTLGGVLQVYDFTPQTHGQGLAVFGDDPGALRMDFASSMTSLSMAFGNDDPRFTAPGDRAWLALFENGSFVDLTSVVMNRDDVMNQTIMFSGAPFNGALFWYGEADTTAINLIEAVDDIRFSADDDGSAVPEPTSMLLVGTGLIVMSRSARGRR
jgi:hypothetical protein